MEFIVNTRYQVLTRNGWKDFSGIKRSVRNELFIVSTKNHDLKGTPEHKVLLATGEFCHLSKLNVGDVLWNNEIVESILSIDESAEVYDLINVDDGHEYLTNGLVSSNCAFIRDFETIWTGLFPTLSEGGNAILLSTPNGVGGMYYKLWTDAVASLNTFKTINLPWHVHPEHDQAWFDKETRNLPKKTISQEFLCDFISSGDTFLQSSEMDYLRSLIKQPKKKESIAGNVWIWEDPKVGHRYVISSDVARGDGADFSTFHIIDVELAECVGEYMGKLPPDKLADLLKQYGERYNTALIAPERNTFGYFTCVRLRDAGYERLYYRNVDGDQFEYVSKDPTAVPGFETQGNTRPQILAKLEELIRNRILTVHSQRFYDQMQAFVWNGSKAQASRDSHDDLIMSMAIGLWVIYGKTIARVNDSESAMALLRGSSLSRRDQSAMPGGIHEVGPVPNAQILGVNPYNVLKPTDASIVRNMSFDFRWLLR